MSNSILVLTLVVFVALCTAAIAASIAWNPPTTYTNGAPVPPGEILGYRIYSGTAIDNQTTLEGEIVHPATQFTLDPADQGRYLTVTALGRAGESAKATPLLWLAPGSPMNLRIIIEMTNP